MSGWETTNSNLHIPHGLFYLLPPHVDINKLSFNIKSQWKWTMANDKVTLVYYSMDSLEFWQTILLYRYLFICMFDLRIRKTNGSLPCTEGYINDADELYGWGLWRGEGSLSVCWSYFIQHPLKFCLFVLKQMKWNFIAELKFTLDHCLYILSTKAKLTCGSASVIRV